MLPATDFFFLSCRSSVVQADGGSAGGLEEGGNVGSGAAARRRAAEGRLPGLPVHRSQPAGHRHARVFQAQDAVGGFPVGPAGTRSSGQSDEPVSRVCKRRASK